VIDWEEQLMRALLFVPGSDDRKLSKVTGFGADLIVIDLEDAVADDRKTAARATTRAALPCYDPEHVVTVRVNGIDTGRLQDDVAAVVCPALDAVLVPKVEDIETLPEVGRVLAAAERANGMSEGSVRILPIIETPLGIARCEEILAHAPTRTVTAIFGLGDFSVALGVDLTPEGGELAYARGRVVVAARAAGMVAPIDGPYFAVEDNVGLLDDSRRVMALGFQGRIAVYPPQVPVINRAFSDLGEKDAARARRVVDAFEQAEARGIASLRVDGRFVDYPIYRLARRKLARFDAYHHAAGTGQ
jgi:citrate lyase subunit beta/citryl-CoA lyase